MKGRVKKTVKMAASELERDEGERLLCCVPITDNTLSEDALSNTRLIKEIT